MPAKYCNTILEFFLHCQPWLQFIFVSVSLVKNRTFIQPCKINFWFIHTDTGCYNPVILNANITLRKKTTRSVLYIIICLQCIRMTIIIFWNQGIKKHTSILPWLQVYSCFIYPFFINKRSSVSKARFIKAFIITECRIFYFAQTHWK